MTTSLTETAHKEQQYLVHTYNRYPVVLESGDGCHVVDSSGKRYLDAITGIGVHALGHRHPRIQKVLIEQASTLVHTSNLFYHRYQGELAERLCGISGMDRVFFSSTGTEAMETALKAVRAHARTIDPKKSRLVSLRSGFHGRTIGSLAVTGEPAYRAPFQPLTPDVTFVDPGDASALAGAVGDDTAAIVLEPVMGEGGIIPLDADFLRTARELATRAGALLIADEIQCGLGRTGRHFAYQWAFDSPIRPDIVVVAKPLAAGLPLAATLFTEEVAQALPAGSHGTTFGGGPLACRVAIEFLALVEDLMQHVQDVGAYLLNALTCLAAKHPIVTEVRGKGLMIGVELSVPARPIVERALERGLLVNATHQTVIRLLPPFTLSRQLADDIVHRLDQALGSVATRDPIHVSATPQSAVDSQPDATLEPAMTAAPAQAR
jgi:predicted acetylornithine/succinylornithine family transaminase